MASGRHTTDRYEQIIESALRVAPLAFEPVAESATTIQVERGIIYPCLVVRPIDPKALEALLLPCLRVPLTSQSVTDRLGHRRPAYRGMLFNCIFRALQLANAPKLTQRFEERFAEQLNSVAMPWAFPETAIPASRAAKLVDALWMTTAVNTALKGGSSPPVADFFGTLLRCQQPTGTFLTPSASDNPETLWYHELVLLHALTLYAADRHDADLDSAIARAAEFHQRETQPDHASNHPWALAAFARSQATWPMADQLLHAAAAQSGDSAITSILLADALYSLTRP